MSELEEYQQLIIPVLKRYFIKRAAIFGSLAKGEMTVNSDIDLLIEPEKGFTLFAMLNLEQEISKLIKRKVDLVEYSALKASIKKGCASICHYYFMSRSDDVYLLDILESIEMILQYGENKTEADFITDTMLQDAVIRRFKIIKEANPGVQWRLMKGVRNKLIHEYFGVSPITVYSTIKLDLPIFKQQLEAFVK